MPETVADKLEDLWPLGVVQNLNGVILLDEHGKVFASCASKLPGSVTGQAGAVGRVLATLEAVENAKARRRQLPVH